MAIRKPCLTRSYQSLGLLTHKWDKPPRWWRDSLGQSLLDWWFWL